MSHSDVASMVVAAFMIFAMGIFLGVLIANEFKKDRDDS